MNGMKVLLVDEAQDTSLRLGDAFARANLHLNVAQDGHTAFDMVSQDRYDLVIADTNTPFVGGLELLKRIKALNDQLPVVLISAVANVETAVDAMRYGAHDFMVKPLAPAAVKALKGLLTNGVEPQTKKAATDRYTIITGNAEMEALLEEARDVADSRASVFIQGESGTGKELFARYIHEHSGRKTRPFVAVNCAALPETLLESELFGHEKGAFTGATSRKKGKFELAHQGTLLLDEISEMDIKLQSKLLRVLQEREVDRVGGTRPIPVDVRVIATTNREIESHIDDNRFREDLYYRLSVIPVHLPPLREKPDDIALLADHFIAKYNRVDRRSVKGLTDAARRALAQMPWKGNVRELENMIERAVLRCKSGRIEPKHIAGGPLRQRIDTAEPAFTPTTTLREMEQKAIFCTLDHTNGNRTHAAEMLGISVRTLRNKLNEYKQKMERQ